MRILKVVVGLACALVASSCGSNPVSPPPVTNPDPPKITCPSSFSVPSPTGQATSVTYGSATVALGKAPVNVSCTPASGSPFPLGSTTVTCTATDALQRTDSCTFAVTVTAPPKISLTRFAAFGDSITWGEDGQNPTSTSSLSDLLRPAVQVGTPYWAGLQILLSSLYSTQTITVANQGCRSEFAGGNSPCADTTYARFTSVVSGGAYQAILIMEGSNDINAQSDNNGDTSYPAAAIANIRSEIEYAKALNVRPYLATIPPMNGAATGPPTRRGEGANFVPPYNQQLAALAKSEGITLVDVFSAISSDGAWPTTLIGTDGLHPTQAGYNAIAQAFFAALKSTLQTTTSPTRTLSAPASLPGRTGSSATPAAAGPGSRAAAPKRR